MKNPFAIIAFTLGVLATGGFSSAHGQANCVTIPAGAVAWWKAAGDASDAIGLNPGSIIGNVSFSSAKVGQGFTFDGATGYVSVPSSPSLKFSGPFTVEGWINFTGPFGGCGGVIVGKGFDGENPTDWALAVSSGSKLRPHANVGGWNYYDCNTTLLPNTWYHVAMVFDGTNLLGYVNGTLDGSQPLSGVPQTTDESLKIGALSPVNGDCSKAFFPGSIDELALYNRALSPQEIQAIYAADSSGKCFGPPSILVQPTNQTVIVGDTARLQTIVSGASLNFQWVFNGTNLPGAIDATLVLNNVDPSQAGNYFLQITSNFGVTNSAVATLTVLPAPPCVAETNGLVAWWPGDGNASDLIGNNSGVLESGVGFTSGKVGSAFQFDGNGGAVSLGLPSVLALQNFTIEAWIQRSSDAAVSGTPGGTCFFEYGYAFGIKDNSLLFLANVSVQPFPTVTATSGLSDTNWHHVAVTKNGINVSFYVDGVPSGSTSGGTGISGFTNSATIGGRRDAGVSNSFLGAIDELAVYARALSAAEIQAIYGARGSGKCNAVAVPPFFFIQPTNRTVTAGNNVTFSAKAGGSVPLSYQWRVNGTNIPSATNDFLTITNIPFSASGNTYSLLASNLAGTMPSSSAVLTVVPPIAAVRALNTNAVAGDFITVPIQIVANGNENTVAFSLTFFSPQVTFFTAMVGSSVPGAAILVNNSQTNSARVGIAVVLPGAGTFPPGTQEVARVVFKSLPYSGLTLTVPLMFGDLPIPRQVTDTQFVAWPASYANSTMLLTQTAYEADTTPRPNGNMSVVSADWIEAGLFAARIDTPAAGAEFQRADCAPRGTRGDGRIKVTDWVQAGRYANGLDPVGIIGGPTNELAPIGPILGGPREVRVANVSSATPGVPVSVSVLLAAQGNENAVGASISFDPAKFTYSSAALGSGASGATLNLNTSQVSSGKLGAVLALPAGSSFVASSQEILKLNLIPNGAASGANTVALADLPVPRAVSDADANELASDYSNGTLIVLGTPVLTVTPSGPNLTIAWPSWAGAFHLQSASTAASGNWTNVVSTLQTNGGTISTVCPVSGGAAFFRLRYP